MWEKKSNVGGLILKILVFLVTVGICVWFVSFYLKTSEANKATDEAYLLQQQAQQLESQGQTQTAANSGLELLNAEYQKDLACVEEYLPGIVCWGDALTGGSAGGVSFPGTLEDLIDQNIVDRYDFHSTIDNADNYKVKWEDYTVDIPVINMGVGEETVDTIMGRMGVVPYAVEKDFTIPAECEPVEIRIKSSNGNKVYPLGKGDGGVNNVIINGIEGTLSVDAATFSYYYTPKYTFTRLTPGAEQEILKDTEILCAGRDMYKDYIHVICAGTFGGFDNIQELIDKTKLMVQHQTKNSDRYVVVGIFHYGNTDWGGFPYDMERYEAAMLQEFGDHYLNIRQYLATDGMNDAGLSPTSTDKSKMNQGYVPDSLKTKVDGKELNAKGYELVGQLLYNKMDKLGYFKEVKDELGVTALEKQDKQTLASQAALATPAVK